MSKRNLENVDMVVEKKEKVIKSNAKKEQKVEVTEVIERKSKKIKLVTFQDENEEIEEFHDDTSDVHYKESRKKIVGIGATKDVNRLKVPVEAQKEIDQRKEKNQKEMEEEQKRIERTEENQKEVERIEYNLRALKLKKKELNTEENLQRLTMNISSLQNKSAGKKVYLSEGIKNKSLSVEETNLINKKIQKYDSMLSKLKTEELECSNYLSEIQEKLKDINIYLRTTKNSLINCFDVSERQINGGIANVNDDFESGEDEVYHYKDKNQNAFDFSYDGDFVLKALKLHICLCSHLCLDRELLYIPYFSAVQSSGSGKTRAFFELGKQKSMYNINVMYFNLRDKEQIGYPCYISVSDHFVKALRFYGDAAAIWGTHFLAQAILAVKADLLGYLSPEPVESDKFWCKVIKNAKKSYNDYKGKLNSALDLFADDDTKFEIISKDLVSDDLISSTCVFVDSVRYLFVFDESRRLIIADEEKTSLFKILRRSLLLFKHPQVMSCFLDTTSEIANFSPPIKYDQSSREANRMLCPPFIHFCSNSSVLEGLDDRSIFFTPEQLFRLGRPLWRSFLDSGANLEDIYRLAYNKLNINDEFTAISIFGICCCLGVSPHSSASSKLVSSHMSYCLGIDQTRESVLSVFPSDDAVLAEAALRLLSQNNFGNLTSYLTILKEYLYKEFIGSDQAAERGEMVVRILLILCFINSPRDGQYLSEPILLSSFFRNFTELTTKASCSDYLVFFTRFVHLQYAPTMEVLITGFKIGVAFVLKRNCPGTDLMIPIYNQATGEYSALLIQVKNHSKVFSTETKMFASVKNKLTSEFTFAGTDLCGLENIFKILWQVGSKKTNTSVTVDENFVSIIGLNIPVLKNKNRNLIEVLRSLTRPISDPMDSHWFSRDTGFTSYYQQKLLSYQVDLSRDISCNN